MIDCYGGGTLWEGQFSNGYINGFARQIEVHSDGKYNSYIGYWKDSRYHGYGLLNEADEYGGLKEGLFEDALFGYPCTKPEDITSFELDELFATPTDFERYGHINYRDKISPAVHPEDEELSDDEY